jgi:hypothetical protein
MSSQKIIQEHRRSVKTEGIPNRPRRGRRRHCSMRKITLSMVLAVVVSAFAFLQVKQHDMLVDLSSMDSSSSSHHGQDKIIIIDNPRSLFPHKKAAVEGIWIGRRRQQQQQHQQHFQQPQWFLICRRRQFPIGQINTPKYSKAYSVNDYYWIWIQIQWTATITIRKTSTCFLPD